LALGGREKGRLIRTRKETQVAPQTVLNDAAVKCESAPRQGKEVKKSTEERRRRTAIKSGPLDVPLARVELALARSESVLARIREQREPSLSLSVSA
jgi:predicted RNA-binding Zn ribbon-like protein